MTHTVLNSHAARDSPSAIRNSSSHPWASDRLLVQSYTGRNSFNYRYLSSLYFSFMRSYCIVIWLTETTPTCCQGDSLGKKSFFRSINLLETVQTLLSSFFQRRTPYQQIARNRSNLTFPLRKISCMPSVSNMTHSYQPRSPCGCKMSSINAVTQNIFK